MTNEARVLACIRDHPEGIDDDEVSQVAGVTPRQQVHQIASRLAARGLIRRESVAKEGKRRKIHNFPTGSGPVASGPGDQVRPASCSINWRRRLAALVAATGKSEAEVLDTALADYAHKVLASLLPQSDEQKGS